MLAWCRNLFVARTFSKAYGLAGLRIGILAGPHEQMPMVRRMSSPYSVNAVALLALPEALEDGLRRDYVAQVKAGRVRLEQEFERRMDVLAQRGELPADEIGERHRDLSQLCDNVGYWSATAQPIQDAMVACASPWVRRAHRALGDELQRSSLRN